MDPSTARRDVLHHDARSGLVGASRLVDGLIVLGPYRITNAGLRQGGASEQEPSLKRPWSIEGKKENLQI